MHNNTVKIAFICYGNACRSQIAEGLLRHYGKGRFDAYSSGINPLGLIPEEVTNILKERGIDTRGLYSKGLSKIPLERLDYIFSLLGESVLKLTTSFRGTEVIWDIPDPYGQSKNAYEQSFDILEKKILKLVETETALEDTD